MKLSDRSPDIDTVFAALAHPARRAILQRLGQGEAMVMELAEPFDMSQPAVSHHVKVLEEAGLILRRVDGTRRPCRLSPHGLATVDRWLEMMREALSANYDRLDALLARTTPTEDERTP